jgi:prepilin-type N-terminal cleavage/methylation domain-containing protein
MSADKYKKNKNNFTGFTLIELLVVISIIGLLAAAALVSLVSARSSARDARRLIDIKQITTSLELYYSHCGSYPLNPPSDDGIILDKDKTMYTGTVQSCGTNRGNGAHGGIGNIPGTGTTIVPVFPTSPLPVDNGRLSTGNKCSEPNPLVPGAVWNDYVYSSEDEKAYTLHFCLSSPVAGLIAGHHTQTEKGIQ